MQLLIGKPSQVVVWSEGNVTIERITEGYCYPKSGNFHNPTPRYLYLLYIDGVYDGCSPLLNVVKGWAEDVVQ